MRAGRTGGAQRRALAALLGALLLASPAATSPAAAQAPEAEDAERAESSRPDSPRPDSSRPESSNAEFPRRDQRGAPGERRGGPAGEFDFYVLALSWSSGYCALDARASGREQCRAGANLGFVVHGLWPQDERGFPTECGPAGRSPSRAAVEGVRGLFPDDGLARHQWRRHGTCSGLSPTDYFAAARRARERVAVPAAFEAARAGAPQRWAPLDVERAFQAANPGLRPGMMAVACRRAPGGGERVMSEVRVCLSRDLREFRACPEVARRGCRGEALAVPGVL